MLLKKIFKNPFLWAFLIGIASLHLIKEFALMRRHAAEPLLDVSDWLLVDQNGENFGQKDLLGKIVITNFFFTSCPSICPKLTEAMKELYKRFADRADKIDFVSITVDPKTDTPEVLRAFKEKNNLSYTNWHLLTGSEEDIYQVVVDKMRMHMGERSEIKGAAPLYDIPHMGHVALFDQKGRLRGLFKTDSIELSALVRAANFLIEKPGT